jgi:hypothetical protein
MAEAGAAFVEVVYALPDSQSIVRVPYRAGMTALDAVRSSGLAERFAEIDPDGVVLGVFGVEVPPGYVLAAGDRVEICRPLQADPREMRRRLAASGRVMGHAEGEDEPDA